MENMLYQHDMMSAGYMTIRPESSGLSAARRWIYSVAMELRLHEEDTTDLLLAVGEAISNAFTHGTPDRDNNFIYVGWRLAGSVLTVTVKDEGPGFKPYDVSSHIRNPDSSRGRGICLIRQTMDEVYFDFEDGAKVVMKKRTSSR